MRSFGTSTRSHSSFGRALLTLRPVSGFRVFTVQFQTRTPRYRSFRSISRIEDGPHACIVLVFGGCGDGTLSAFSELDLGQDPLTWGPQPRHLNRPPLLASAK